MKKEITILVEGNTAEKIEANLQRHFPSSFRDKKMEITSSKSIFKYNELSEKAKEKAIENLNQINTDFEWWDSDYDDFSQIADILGIDLKVENKRTHIYFSGFSSQGDGASWEGSYKYTKGSAKKIRAYAPTDKELHRIADQLQSIQKENMYRISASVKHRGHYYHSGCMDVTVFKYDVNGNETDLKEGIEKEVTQLLRDFADWIYKHLENQYDYLTSKEAIEKTIEANEDWEFYEDGTKV